MEEPCLLQHPEGVHPPPGLETERRSHRAFPEDPGPEVQLRQDDLSHVLRQAAPQGRQLQEEAVRTQQQPQTKEEAEVNHELLVLLPCNMLTCLIFVPV